MTTVIASDLDRTLIFSAAAATTTGAAAAADLVCVEMLEGRPQSFMTGAAHRLLTGLRDAAVFVPTTTRTPEQYRRVRLPGGPAPFAVVSNGGHILLEGVPDVAWRAGVQERVAAAGAPLAEVVAHIDARTDGSWVRSRRVADNLFCYLVVEVAALPRHFVADLAGWGAERGWVVSMQGRKIYALPAALTKEAAIAEIVRRVGGTRLLAAGDGTLDAGMLAAADDGIRPAHGELHENGWGAPHVRVTAGIGALAGEEIVRWLAAQVS